MRVFIAIELNEEVKKYIGEFQELFKTYCKKGNFTPIDNVHITLRFIGEIDIDDIERIKEAMYKTSIYNKAFKLSINELGFFERNDSNIAWIGIDKNNFLIKLHNSLERSLLSEGFKRDRQKLVPHITIAREVKTYIDLKPLKKKLLFNKQEMYVDKIVLMESVRNGSKLIYRPLIVQKLKSDKKY